MTTPANPDTSNSVGATDDASSGGLLNTGSDTILNSINTAIASNAEAAQTAATAAGASASNAAASATNAATSATTASTKASEAAADAVNTAADAVNTAADRVQTGLDRTAANTSASNAATSETNAAGSATAAAGSASSVAANAAAAAASETAAAASETAAASSETNAATSASTASTKASEASTSATNAANSATSASTAQTAAETAETNAETAETNAETAETNAANSATAAANSATTSATSATNASNSASAASTSETNAATSETNAATSASTASTQATNASNSATSAATSATNASNSASAASTSETNAAASESAAATSETNAASSETNAATSASTASTQATNASTSATAAATSATASATSATASETAKTASEAARDQALAAFDNFDDKYLGEKSSDPTVDNDGDPLQAGMLYFNTTDNVMKVYTGSAWVAAYVSGQGFASLSGADFTGAITAPSINLASTTLVNSILDEDNMASNSATALSTQQAIKSYVDTQIATVPVGDITAVTAGTGLSGGGTSGAVTLNIDSTVATLTGTQTLTNKTLGATSLTGNLTFTGAQTVDGRDVSVDGTKLDTIETNADVTDTTNVTAAGALMDSEVTNLAQVKAFDSSNYATAAQGTTADAALPRSGGAMTGAITTNSTFDGRDVSVDGAKLDGIEAGATTDQTAAEIRALVESATDSNVFTDADHSKLNGIEAGATTDQTASEIRALVESATDSNVFTDADHTKLNSIEASADVTDAANVEPLVDAHLNTSTASSSEVLSWTGTDYDWVVPASGGISNVVDDTSPQLGGDLESNSFDIKLASNDRLYLGNSNHSSIYSNGAELRLYSGGSTRIIGSDITFATQGGGEEYASFSADGSVDLYHNNIKKFETTSTGVTVTGTLAATAVTGDGSGLTNLPSSGGADLYAANEVSVTAQPSATGDDAVAIGDSAVSSGANAIAFGFSSLASGFNAISIGNGESNNSNTIAIGGNSLSSGTQSFADGHSSVSTGGYSHATTNSRASGSNSFAAAIANNTSSYGTSGNNSVAIGRHAKATNTGATSIGYNSQATAQETQAVGSNAIASGLRSSAFGYQAKTFSSPQYSIVLGPNSSANANNTTALGYQAQASTVIGRHGYGNGYFAATGDSQHGLFILRSDTTDATAEALTTNNSTASTNNQLILPNNSAYSFLGTIIAREDATDGSDYASWEIKGALLRDANAASTVLGNGIQNKLYATAGASAWAIALTADTTNGGLKIEVTGAASTNIRWVATVHTSEVTYA
jgi:hypothetical protein